MSPVIKPDDTKVKQGTIVSFPQLSQDVSKMTPDDFVAMLGQVFTALAHDAALLQKFTSEHSQDEVTVSQAMSKQADKETQDFLKQLAALQQQIQAAESGASSSIFDRSDAAQNAQLLQQLLAQLQSLIGTHFTVVDNSKTTDKEVQKLIEKLLTSLVALCEEVLKAVASLPALLHMLSASSETKPSTTPVSTPASIPASPSSNTDGSSGVSEQQFLDQIFQILTELAHDLGLLIKYSAENQQDQVAIAKQIAANVHTQTEKFLKKLEEEKEAEEKANSGFLGFLHKVFGNGILSTILMGLIGAIFCETGFGALMLAAAVTLQATGTMDKMTKGLGDLMGGSELAQMFAGMALSVVFTGGAGAADTVAMKSVAEGVAAKFTTEEVASVSSKEIEMVSMKAADKSVAKEAEDEAAKDGSKEAGNADKKTGNFRFGTAAAGTFSASLFGTNWVFHMLMAAGVPKDKAELIAAIINSILSAIAMLGAGIANSGEAMQQLKNMNTAGRLVEGVSAGVGVVTTAGTSYMNIDQGLINIDEGNIKGEMAPIQELLTKLEGLLKVNDTNYAQSQKFYQQLTNTRELIMNTDFAIAWETVVQG